MRPAAGRRSHRGAGALLFLQRSRMSPRRRPVNPFYVLLVLTGIVFSVSACAYGVMAWRAIRVGPSASDEAGRGLLTFLDQHGGKLLAGELAVLALATFGAIGTDSYWSQRDEKSG